uniref:Uncharacterized protein n=1 Tax=Rhizophagus irregularis (strain DAOM 181602 / DAOM 197198 / MUCL 43194) TaxID=747089 RepID=U9UIJ2_RHIID
MSYLRDQLSEAHGKKLFPDIQYGYSNRYKSSRDPDVGEHIQSIVEALLYREKSAAVKYEQIKMQNAEILDNSEDLKKMMADTSLANGLVTQDLENRIRNLEADVIAKE